MSLFFSKLTYAIPFCLHVLECRAILFLRAEELEEQRRKLAARLQEATEQREVLNQKNMSLEKIKSRLTGEIDEMHVEVERAQQLAAQMEKKAKSFDKIIAEWKMKVRFVGAEKALDGEYKGWDSSFSKLGHAGAWNQEDKLVG